MQDLGKMMMTWGKWSMYLSALLFLVIGTGALAIAVVPGVDEWFAESILDASGAPDDQFLVDAITDQGAVGSTMLILGLTFLPTAALFWWCGRWFKQIAEGRTAFGGFGVPAPNLMAAYQPMAQPGGPMPGAGVAAPPSAGPPVVDPPDPTAGGIIT